MRKKGFTKWIALVTAVMVTAVPVYAQDVDSTAEPVTEAAAVSSELGIAITVPSENEKTIAPRRSFYVKGTFSKGVSEGSKVTVTVKKAGQENPARTISTNIKANKNKKVNMLTLKNPDEEQWVMDSAMPDLIWDGTNESSAKNGDLKCYYDDAGFCALIPGGKTELSVDDTLNLVDTSGQPYAPLADGAYTVSVEVEEPGAAKVVQTTDITIGTTQDKILARFSPDTHKDRVTAFAGNKGYRMYMDPFPGYWNAGKNFCEIAPEWRAADATEYTEGKVHFVIYNVKGTSTTYGVELGLLQDRQEINTRLSNYYYSTGEPAAVAGVTSAIEAFAAGDKLQLVRAELNQGEEKDGVLNQDRTAEPAYDMNVMDGVTANAGENLSLYGVTAPIQIAASDIQKNTGTLANTYTLNNKIKKIVYQISGSGVDQTYEKEVILNRKSGGWDNYSELEFKHVIPVTYAMAGKTLTVSAKGYDAHGAAISGTEETFSLTVPKDTAKSPKTGEGF